MTDGIASRQGRFHPFRSTIRVAGGRTDAIIMHAGQQDAQHDAALGGRFPTASYRWMRPAGYHRTWS